MAAIAAGRRQEVDIFLGSRSEVGVLKRTQLSDPSGTETATLDANGNIATRTDRLARSTHYTYDLTRNLEISRTEAYGTSIARTITTTWNPTYRLPATITEPSGVAGVNLVTTFTYDAAGNLIEEGLRPSSKVHQGSPETRCR
ncbi:MAG TPA: hypothetical protein VEG27_01750 [Usitatibacter sp.]|nr:hypothetical protein [Usitatibacter sp.]